MCRGGNERGAMNRRELVCVKKTVIVVMMLVQTAAKVVNVVAC